MSHLLNRETSPQECSCLTVLREDHVDILDSSGTANTSSLFAELSHVETDPALSLSLIVHNIGLVHHNHGAEHLLHGVVIDGPLKLLIDDVAVFVHDAEALEFVELAAELEVVRELVLEHLLVDFAHCAEGTLSGLDKLSLGL